MQLWEIYLDGNIIGPIHSNKLLSMAQQGTISEETYVRVVGDTEWSSANDIKGLFRGQARMDDSPPRNVAIPPVPLPAKPEETDDAELAEELMDNEQVSCPHCWWEFSLYRMLYISRHPDLTDANGRQHRFLPRQFNPAGLALDEKGIPCPDMACPRCQQKIPKIMIDQESFIISIVGAPASGKSYFLTSMLWTLHRQLPTLFSLSINDADVQANSIINGYQDLLFRSITPDQPVLIQKTALDAASGSSPYEEVMINGVAMTLPRPFMFSLKPRPTHPKFEELGMQLRKNLVLYDNAGEHFQAGADGVNSPGTQHVVSSAGIIYLFDPSKDATMLASCNVNDPQVQMATKTTNQSVLFNEMVNRIHMYSGMNSHTKLDKPVIIAVSKYDMWKSLLPEDLVTLDPWEFNEQTLTYELNYQTIMNISFHLREIMLNICPDLVNAAESLSSKVYFIPTSALGGAPIESPEIPGQLMVKPKDINPIWITVPALLIMAENDYISIKKETNKNAMEITNHRIVQDHFVFTLPGTRMPMQVPLHYAGVRLYHSETDCWFKLPNDKCTKTTATEQQRATKVYWEN